jgi:uncharacterized hydrophobic protein (TIGR00271 family)
LIHLIRVSVLKIRVWQSSYQNPKKETKAMGLLSNIVQDNKFTPEDVPKFEAKLFFEGAKRRKDLEQFAVLLFLSTVIATYGVLGDSTATVIGAMIIAPLMRPIMATAAALVTGRMDRAIYSSLIVAAGVAGVIGVSWLLTAFNFTTVVSFETNSQITGRISPRLIDLYAALASGAAGAFAMSRDDVADSLPGVAISISLVPPLCVAGVGLAEGQWDASLGALVLFMTNFLSILLAGGGTLALLGLAAAATKDLRAEARRRAFLLVALGIVIVAIPLAATSIQVARESLTESATRRLAQDWVGETDYEVSRVDANGNQVNLIINGSGDPPLLSELGTSVGAALNRLVDLKLTIVPSQEEYYEAVPE